MITKIGDIAKSKQGYLMEIIDIKDSHNVTIKFDDGAIKTNVDACNFRKGQVAHPICPKTMNKSQFNNLLNSILTDSNGWEAKITKFRNTNDIDIIFIDGNVEVKHQKLRELKNHNFAHPNRRRISKDEYESRMNMIMRKGDAHFMRILNYRSAGDIDVIFDNNPDYILYHKSYAEFKDNAIGYPGEPHRINTLDKSGLLHAYKNIKASAKSRNIQFQLTLDEVNNIIHKPCYLCGTVDSISYKTKHGTYTYNGIDRIDSNKPYVYNNCEPCCTMCNIMKNKYDITDFKRHIKMIYEKSIA